MKEKDLREKVDFLMDMNQALKAWELVEDTDSDLKDKVWEKVKHAFDPDEYLKYYENGLIEQPMPLEWALNATAVFPRLTWVVASIVEKGQTFVCDLGCADGYLGLTLGRYNHVTIGVNLHEPSVKLANSRARMLRLPCHFLKGDLMTHTGEYDAVVLMEVLEHLPDPKRAIQHAYSLVRDGGSLYMSTPRDDHTGIAEHLKDENREGWDDGKPSGHLRLWSEKEFKSLLEPYNVAQFEVDETHNMLVEVVKNE